MLSAVRIPFDIRIKRSVDTAAVIGKEQTRRGMICWATFIQHFATHPNSSSSLFRPHFDISGDNDLIVNREHLELTVYRKLASSSLLL